LIQKFKTFEGTLPTKYVATAEVAISAFGQTLLSMLRTLRRIETQLILMNQGEKNEPKEKPKTTKRKTTRKRRS
jgi:hypothetical protein